MAFTVVRIMVERFSVILRNERRVNVSIRAATLSLFGETRSYGRQSQAGNTAISRLGAKKDNASCIKASRAASRATWICRFAASGLRSSSTSTCASCAGCTRPACPGCVCSAGSGGKGYTALLHEPSSAATLLFESPLLQELGVLRLRWASFSAQNSSVERGC